MKTFGLVLIFVLVQVCHAVEQKPDTTAKAETLTYDGKTLNEWIALAKQQNPAARWAPWEKMAPAAVQALTELLKHTDRQVRDYAASALERIGPQATNAVPDLIALLKDRDAGVRQTVAEALGAIDGEVKTTVPALTGLLHDDDWFVRWTAAWTLRKMGPRANAAIPALTQLLQDTNVRVREAATKAVETISGSGAKPAPLHTDGLVGDETEYQAWHTKLTEDRWKSLLQRAGEPDAGVILEARLVTESPLPGEDINLIFSLRNMSDRPFQPGWASLRPFESVVEPKLLIRNSKGEPVELTRKGMRKVYETFFGGGSGFFQRLAPGRAWGDCMTVSDYFDLSKPGDYTILVWGGEVPEDTMMVGIGGAFRRNVGIRGWVAKPIALTVGKHAASGEDEHRPASTPPKERFPKSTLGDSAEKEWSDLTQEARHSHHKCILDATCSPLAPSAVHLVVSLICLDLDHYVGARFTQMGENPANYRVLVRDSAGRFVPLTDFGREVFSSRGKESVSCLWTGDAHGTVFPLDEMFALNAGQDYTVLVSLPPEATPDSPWVARPVKIHVPALEVPGVTRPRYGSEKMWIKLAATASASPTDLTLENKMEYGFAAYLRMKLTKEPKASNGDWRMADKTVLLQDSRGRIVLPGRNSPLIWWTEGPWEICVPEELHAKQVGKKLPKVKEMWSPLSDVFPLRSGCRYTLISALNLTGSVQPLIVSKPVTFSMPVPGSRHAESGESREVANPPTTTSQPMAPSFDVRWEEAVHFAGKPFDGLALKMSAEKAAELRIVLCNQGKRPVLVKKWKGDSDYDFLVRGPNGSPVAMTENGKKFFNSSQLLDVRTLAARDTIDTRVRIKEFFDMRVPGEYTIVASLPVVGDVDAVLTTTLVKVRVP